MTTIDDVLNAVVTRVAALALEFNEAAVPVGKRKFARQEDGDTAHVQFTVSAAQRPREIKRFTSRHDLITHRAELVFWTPGNGDNRANLSELSRLELAAQQAFNRKPADLLGLDGLRDVRAETGTYLDRGAAMQGWDASLTNITVEVVEERAAL